MKKTLQTSIEDNIVSAIMRELDAKIKNIDNVEKPSSKLKSGLRHLKFVFHRTIYREVRWYPWFDRYR